MTGENFRTRSAMIAQKHQDFLQLLVSLGGYCTVAQAEQWKLADTDRRTRGHLRRLEHLGFLRRVAAYPVVYQVTKSTTRHLGRDSCGRRRHPLATVQARLLAVDFYLEARCWPSEFILDHQHKIRTLTEAGCPLSVLPQRVGKPYLREEFLLWLPDGRLGIAIVDQPHLGALSQMLGLVRCFAPTIRYLGEATVELLIVTGSQRHYYRYRRLLQHPRLADAWPSDFEFAVRPYCVLRTTPEVAALRCPRCHCREHQSETTCDPTRQKRWNPSRRTTQVSPLDQKRPAQPIPAIHCDLID